MWTWRDETFLQEQCKAKQQRADTMTPEQMQAERQQFEHEIRETLGKHVDLSRDPFLDYYIDSSIDERWNGWMMKAHLLPNQPGK